MGQVAQLFSNDVLVTVHGWNPNKLSNDAQDFLLSKFQSSTNRTAWQMLRDEVVDRSKKFDPVYVFEVSLCFVQGTQLQRICSMKGDQKWFEKLEYFKKYIGDMGGSAPLEALGFGVMDFDRKIRVEFEQGFINITPIKTS